jgi:hypothetical protein
MRWAIGSCRWDTVTRTSVCAQLRHHCSIVFPGIITKRKKCQPVDSFVVVVWVVWVVFLCVCELCFVIEWLDLSNRGDRVSPQHTDTYDQLRRRPRFPVFRKAECNKDRQLSCGLHHQEIHKKKIYNESPPTKMHRGLDCLLLLWWIVTTLTVVLGWPINQPNAQPTEIVASQYHSSSPALCNDSRCSCTSHSPSQHAGLTHVNCQCTPQDQVHSSITALDNNTWCFQ